MEPLPQTPRAIDEEDPARYPTAAGLTLAARRSEMKRAWSPGQALQVGVLFWAGSIGDCVTALGRFLDQRLRAVRVLEHDAQPFLRDRQPRGDGALGNA